MESTTILEYYEAYEYCYDRENKNLLVRYSEDGTLEKYVYGNGLIASSETRQSQNPKYRTYLYDLRGSVTFTLDSSANITSEYQYSTYGNRNVIKGSTTSELGYCARDGVLTEVTGLLYMRARYYMPNLMRFINQDIVTGDISNSNSLNRYTYVEGNPATMIDPFGLCAERAINAVEGSYNIVKGTTVAGMSTYAIKAGTVVIATGGPLGWAIGGLLIALGSVGLVCGLSDIREGSQQVSNAILDTNGPTTNIVRDTVFNGDQIAYNSFEMVLPDIMYSAAGWGQTYVNSRGSKVSLSKAASYDNSETRPTWRQSETEAKLDFPDYRDQVSFINGEECSYGTKGSVRPDYYKVGDSVDIKNYNVETASGRNNLANNISKQYYQRNAQLPPGTKQTVLIDIRGQNVSNAELENLYNSIMEKTNNGITVLFKTE